MSALEAQRRFFDSGATMPLGYRRASLNRLLDSLARWEVRLSAALLSDLGKSAFDSYTGEILHVRQEARHALSHLQRWAAPRRVRTGWFHWPARAAVEMRPRGVALILGPWNYPVQLSLLPLVSAVAAGNCAVLKPSELAPETSKTLAGLVSETFDQDHVQVESGGPQVAHALITQPFDYIFFTGSTAVGRSVAVEAARNLVDCTLELGGCNPCVVDASADPVVTARRIAWGKFLNAGQTCIAPNHVLVHESRYESLLHALGAALATFYGQDGRGMSRVVNARHFERLASLLGEGRVAHGGAVDAPALHIQPTVLVDVPAGSPVLSDEIFGPILPVARWGDKDALLRTLADAPSPLALYVHSRDRAFIAACLDRTRSGSAVINDHIVQATVPDLPFGGVGPSGHGRYHGQAGFEAFSYSRSTFHHSARIDLPMRYPPHGNRLALVKRFMG